jgi:hypothetical protein
LHRPCSINTLRLAPTRNCILPMQNALCSSYTVYVVPLHGKHLQQTLHLHLQLTPRRRIVWMKPRGAVARRRRHRGIGPWSQCKGGGGQSRPWLHVHFPCLSHRAWLGAEDGAASCARLSCRSAGSARGGGVWCSTGSGECRREEGCSMRKYIEERKIIFSPPLSSMTKCLTH